MDNTFNFPKAPHFGTAAASPSRRSFMRYLTMGAAALAVEGCGGGGGGDIATAAPVSPPPPVAATPAPSPAPLPVPPAVTPAPAPATPVWLSIPTIAFTEGTPSSFSVADYITAADVAAFRFTLNATPLPAGVTFNGTTRSFDYDGRGAPAASDGHVLTAVGA